MFCLACGDDLKERQGDRRVLCSSKTRHVIPMLLDTAKNAVGKDVKFDEEKLNACFICKPCFKQMEKLQMLQKQMGAVQGLLHTNIGKALPYLPLVPESSTSQIDHGSGQDEDSGLLGRKRQLSPQREATKSPKRRRQIVRSLARATVAPSSTNSPAVSVSTN